MKKNLVFALISILVVVAIVGCVLLPESAEQDEVMLKSEIDGEQDEIESLTSEIEHETITTSQVTKTLTSVQTSETLTSVQTSETRTSDNTSDKTSQMSPFGTDLSECSKENNMLTSVPISLNSNYDILPLGKISGWSHITPTDHWYFDVDIVDDEPVDILAPASGYIVKLDLSLIHI